MCHHFSEDLMEMFDGITNSMGEPCNSCTDFECEHNNNEDNPEWLFDGSGEPQSVEEFVKCNSGENDEQRQQPTGSPIL